MKKKFKILSPYGGSVSTHKQCPICKQWLPKFMKACLCGEVDEIMNQNKDKTG